MDGNEECESKACSLVNLSETQFKLITTLDLSGQQLKHVPELVAELENLNILDISRNEIKFIPQCIEKLKFLEEVNAAHNLLENVSSLPSTLLDSKSPDQSLIDSKSIVGSVTASKFPSQPVTSPGFPCKPAAHSKSLTKPGPKSDVDSKSSDEAASPLPEFQHKNEVAESQIVQVDSIYSEEELNSVLSDKVEEIDWSTFAKLHTVNLSHNHLTEFPRTLCFSKNIVNLNMSNNKIRCLPAVFYSYSIVRHLLLENIEFCHMFEFPTWIFHITRCTVLSFANSYLGSLLESVPCDFGYVCRLFTKLDLREIGLRDFPECVLSMLDLEHLWLSNSLTSTKLNPLSQISRNHNMVWALPDRLGSLTHLSHFEICNVRLSIIPSSFCKLTNLTYLAAASNSLQTLPNQFFNLVKLEFLDLSDNELIFLPGGLGKLTKLKVLNLSHNGIYDLRDVENLDNLSQLDLYSNRLSDIQLPPNILLLDLAGNKICKQYLTDKYGGEFVLRYNEMQDGLRKKLDCWDRTELEESLKEEERQCDQMSDVSEQDSLDTFHNNIEDDSLQKEVEDVDSTDEDDEWNEFQPVRSKATLANKSKLYKSYPDAGIRDAVFCPAESHPLSHIKTSRTTRASTLNSLSSIMPDDSGQFEDAD